MRSLVQEPSGAYEITPVPMLGDSAVAGSRPLLRRDTVIHRYPGARDAVGRHHQNRPVARRAPEQHTAVTDLRLVPMPRSGLTEEPLLLETRSAAGRPSTRPPRFSPSARHSPPGTHGLSIVCTLLEPHTDARRCRGWSTTFVASWGRQSAAAREERRPVGRTVGATGRPAPGCRPVPATKAGGQG